MSRTRIAIAALALCAAFSAAAKSADVSQDPRREQTLQQLDDLTERALISEDEALHAVPALIMMTHIDDDEIRTNAIESLGYIARKHPATAAAAFSALAAMTTQPNLGVAVSAVRQIGNVSGRNPALAPSAITMLSHVIMDKSLSDYVRFEALNSLANTPGKDPVLADQARAAITPVFTSPDASPDLRANAAIAMWAAHVLQPFPERQRAAETLVPLLAAPEQGVSAAADRYYRLLLCKQYDPNECLRPDLPRPPIYP